MSKKIISEELSKRLFSHVNKYWDTDEYRWYPLAETKSNVFCVDDQQIELIKLKQALIYIFVEKVYVIHEYNIEENYIIDIKDLQFNTSLNIEQFIFDDSFKWVIYIAHEGYITLGGFELIDKVRELHNGILNHVIL